MNDLKKNKELVATFCAEVFNNHNLGGLDRYMREDYIQHNPNVAQGMAGFTEYFEKTFQAMPDFHYEINQIIAEGDLVWIYCHATATHTGGPWRGVSRSGNRLDVLAVDMYRVQDGKIAEHWDVVDTHTMFSQLGISPQH